jgi:hypothetical protein
MNVKNLRTTTVITFYWQKWTRRGCVSSCFVLCSSRTVTKRSLFPVGRRQSLNMAAKLRQVLLLHFRLLYGTYIAHSQSNENDFLQGKIHQLVTNFISTLCCNCMIFLQNEHERSFISCDTLNMLPHLQYSTHNSSSTHFMVARNQKGIRKEKYRGCLLNIP